MKIRIIGPTGAGKTYLSHFLSRISGYPVYHTDDIVYQEHFSSKRPKTEQVSILNNILHTQKDWIIEGTTIGHTFWPSIETADLIIYCDQARYILRYRIITRYFHGQQKGQKFGDIFWLLKYACDYQNTQHGVQQTLTQYADRVVIWSP